MAVLVQPTGTWACPTCFRSVVTLSDVWDCMFDDAPVCLGCYPAHNETKHPELYAGVPEHATCQHGFPSIGKCQQCKR